MSVDDAKVLRGTRRMALQKRREDYETGMCCCASCLAAMPWRAEIKAKREAKLRHRIAADAR